jgi:hypothetical protein
VIGLGIALLVYLVIIELLRAPEPKEPAAGAVEAAAAPEEEKIGDEGESNDETPAAQQAGEEEAPKEE